MNSKAFDLVLVLAIIAFAFAVVKATEDKDDGETIQGTWQVISMEDSGRPAPKDYLKEIKFVITKDTITFTSEGKTIVWPYTLDPSKKPKWIDIVNKEAEHTMLGIYELDGDSLKLCYAEFHPKRKKDERSSAFESKPDSANDVFVILKREKK